jgi:hypothetical protein
MLRNSLFPKWELRSPAKIPYWGELASGGLRIILAAANGIVVWTLKDIATHFIINSHIYRITVKRRRLEAPLPNGFNS